MRYSLAFLALTACGSDPGAPPISAEPAPRTTAHATTSEPAPVPTVAPVPLPTLRAPDPIDPPPVQNTTPAPGAPPADDPNAPPVGYHLAPGGACYLPNVLHVGECKCAVYQIPGNPSSGVVSGGEQCADSCSTNSDGVTVFHTFCVDGGLTAEMRPR